MNTQINYLVCAFYISAAVIGLPALWILASCAIFKIRLWMLPRHAESAPLKNPDAILVMITGIARAIGFVATLAGGLGKAVLGIAAIIASLALLLAIALYYIGHGLATQQPWARGAGGLLMIGLLLASIVLLLTLRDRRRLVALLFVAGSIFALRILWIGFTL